MQQQALLLLQRHMVPYSSQPRSFCWAICKSAALVSVWTLLASKTCTHTEHWFMQEGGSPAVQRSAATYVLFHVCWAH